MEPYVVLPVSAYRNYLDRRKTDLSRLQRALQDGSIEEFRVIGHQLKGNAPSFQYEELGHLGEKLELVTQNTLMMEAPGLLADFEAWIRRTEKSLEESTSDQNRLPALEMTKWGQIKREILTIWATLSEKELDQTGGDFENIVTMITRKYDLDQAHARERVIEVLGHFIRNYNS